MTYGLEYRLHRTYINEIEDPSKISHIIGLDMYSKGIILSIGTIFGGNKTSADHSFLKMLNGNYMSAEAGFENYINSINPRPRKKLVKKTKISLWVLRQWRIRVFLIGRDIDSGFFLFWLRVRGVRRRYGRLRVVLRGRLQRWAWNSLLRRHSPSRRFCRSFCLRQRRLLRRARRGLEG